MCLYLIYYILFYYLLEYVLAYRREMAEKEKHGKTAAAAASCFITTKYSQINYFTKPPDNSVSKSSQ